MHNALDTLCDSKLHHHGNHYQKKRVMKEWMEEGGEDRSAGKQRDREKRDGGRGQRRSSCLKGRNAETTLYTNSVDLI